MDQTLNKARQEIQEALRATLSRNPLILDTETTGLKGELCDIAIIDMDGNILLDTLVRPIAQIQAGATAVHGISDKDVETAPTFAQALHQIQVIKGRVVICYNVEFDRRVIRESAKKWRIEEAEYAPENWTCAMEMYARWWGDFSQYHRSYKWQKLTTAMEQQKIDVAGMQAHRALADAEMTRRLVLKLVA